MTSLSLRKGGRRRRQHRQQNYNRLAIQVDQAETAGDRAAERLEETMRSGMSLSEVRVAYRAVGMVVQEPLPATPALDPRRPPSLTRQLSTLRTHRQWYLMGAPPGALAPAVVRPGSRAALGPHVAGLEADFAERPWGVDLEHVLDTSVRR